MFLQKLSKIEKEGFLELAYLIANSDGEFCSEEVEMISIFRNEMELFEYDYKISELELEQILNMFKDSSLKNKKIVILEILGIVLSDEIVAEEELNILIKLSNSFKLSKDFLERSQELVQKLKALYISINELFNAEVI